MAIQDIIKVSPEKRTENQERMLNACLTALAHQPKQWWGYQDWEKGNPVEHLKKYGIELQLIPDIHPEAKSYYNGCGCKQKHWKQIPRE